MTLVRDLAVHEQRDSFVYQPVPEISVVVPVWNGAGVLPRCLEAIWQNRDVAWECIVVDDGSTDESVTFAHRWGARVLRTAVPRSGPGHARNIGARAARAPIVLFVDADVVVRPDTLAKFVTLFRAEPALDAAFGSYDDQPYETDSLSQYRNLLHHFVHQQGSGEASTFWAGCGAVRREVFLAIGGFNPAYGRPSIEDIELGYRLRQQGGQIRLAKDIQVKHLKRWTFWGILRTDIRDRALPWTELIARTRYLPNDLNLNLASRLSALSVYLLGGLALLGLLQPVLWLATLVPIAFLMILNRNLYRFLLQRGGFWLLVHAVPMHWLYYGYSALLFALGSMWFRWQPIQSTQKRAEWVSGEGAQ